MAEAMRFILTNMPAILFVLALAIPTIRRDGPPATRYLTWLLLLSVGVESIWGGFFHVFFPQVAAASIGWQVSPFQYEMGVADLALGITAVVSFWQGFGFRAAVVLCTVLVYIGVTMGHLRQVIVAQDYSANNFGVLLLLTVIKIVLLSVLLAKARREKT